MTNFVTSRIFTLLHTPGFLNESRELQRGSIELDTYKCSVLLGLLLFGFISEKILETLFSIVSWSYNFLAWVGTVLAPIRGRACAARLLFARPLPASRLARLAWAFSGLQFFDKSCRIAVLRERSPIAWLDCNTLKSQRFGSVTTSCVAIGRCHKHRS